jgi:thiamine monophosphate synthase
MSRHLNKNYIENFFFFTDLINNEIIHQILKFKNISLIYNTLDKNENLKELMKIKLFCNKNNIKLYIKNNIKLAVKIKADGVFLNNEFKKKILQKNEKLNFKIIVGIHSVKEFYLKKYEHYSDVIISPIFYNKKYSINKILNPVKFNLMSLYWKKRKYALGGINKNNFKKIYLTSSIGVGFVSLINDLKIKKPVCFFNKRAFNRS